ncbi:hypothetical protein HAX54_051256 [Datura stramonium]|uniref:Putative plant transposon protein domain-containing protein n=1 Tax=Datura stramonium TaxID=4076 RepID=A0ABS8WS23_DATST|nr:hypothetical protein [Datura stramonium]
MQSHLINEENTPPITMVCDSEEEIHVTVVDGSTYVPGFIEVVAFVIDQSLDVTLIPENVLLGIPMMLQRYWIGESTPKVERAEFKVVGLNVGASGDFKGEGCYQSANQLSARNKGLEDTNIEDFDLDIELKEVKVLEVMALIALESYNNTSSYLEGVMSLKADKEKEVEITNKGLKRLCKGTKGSSSLSTKGTPSRRFGAKAMEPHGLKWFQAQKEPEECNLTLVREFNANWDTSFGERTKVKIWGPVVHFTTKTFNVFLGTPVVDPSEYFILLEKPPYHDIRHDLYGEHLSVHWARDQNGTYSTLPFSYLNNKAKVWVKLVYAVILGDH